MCVLYDTMLRTCDIQWDQGNATLVYTYWFKLRLRDWENVSGIAGLLIALECLMRLGYM